MESVVEGIECILIERIFIMIKLIASDIDGTLVKDGTLAIDREYMDVIGKLIDKGIVFVACSGRQYRSERKLFAPIYSRLWLCRRWWKPDVSLAERLIWI